MDFSFVGQESQQKWKTILKIPSCSQIFQDWFIVHYKVLVQQQHRFINDDTVQKCILHSNSCLAVSGFTMLFLPLSLYVYALQLHGFCRDIWGAIPTILCRDSKAVDSKLRSRRRSKNRKCIFVEDKDSMLGGPQVFHLTNMICRIVVFYYKDCRNKNDRQIWVSELFLLIEFLYKGRPMSLKRHQTETKLCMVDQI